MKKKDIKDISEELYKRNQPYFFMGDIFNFTWLKIYYCGQLVYYVNANPFGTDILGNTITKERLESKDE